MFNFNKLMIFLLTSFQLGGCGATIPNLHELADADDPDATTHMEKQIKLAVYCELRDAVFGAQPDYRRRYNPRGKNVTSKDDQLLPSSWGAQVTLTFQVDETGRFNPGLSVFRPLDGPFGSQNFTAGLGAGYSSAATRIDKFETFYSFADIGIKYSEYDDCSFPPGDIYPKDQFGRRSMSSQFTIISDLGIKRWLLQAAEVNGFERSSRQAADDQGPPPKVDGFSPDSFSYDIKFVITTEGTISPTFKLSRVSGPGSQSLIDVSRMRTHELLITVAPSTFIKVPVKGGYRVKTVPNAVAQQSHFAQEIGNAVANAIRGTPGLQR